MKVTTKATREAATRPFAPTDKTPIRDWVDFCVGCANETHSALLSASEAEDEDISAEAITVAMRESYGAAMPLITDGYTARVYIACVAHGLAIGIFPGDLAGKLVYVAQTALSALGRI